MKSPKQCYQADAKDSTNMTKAEPNQLPDKPKAPKKTQPELKLIKAESKTEAKTKPKAGTTDNLVLPLPWDPAPLQIR